ncbi:MAG TPA: DUF748 domain-containing protein [Opitutaceae bacterium]|nr:DUF748 domain-containing protein [Opitutaceae bacterium]
MKPAPRAPNSGHPILRRVLIGLAIVVGVALLLQLVATPVATALTKRKLAANPDYAGNVRVVSLALWKLGIDVEDLTLYSKNGDNKEPLVRIKEASLRVAFSGLLRGKLGGELKLDHPEANIVKTERTDLDQKEDEAKEKAAELKLKTEKWRAALQSSFPLELTKLEVTEGKVHFVDRAYTPNVDFTIDHIHLVGTGLSNRPSPEDLPAKLTMQGVSSGHGKITLNVEANPLADKPRFHVMFEISDLNLPDLNSMLLAYAKADVSRGTFDFNLEANARDGGYEGYVKPFLKNIEFKTPSDDKETAAKRMVKSVANAAVSLLKNKEDQKVATKAPFSGTFVQNDVDVWTTVQNLLRNAFIKALREGFDSGSGKSS